MPTESEERTSRLNCWLSGYILAQDAEIAQSLAIDLMHRRIPPNAVDAVKDTIRGTLEKIGDDGGFIPCVTPTLGNRLSDAIVGAKVAFERDDIYATVRHLQAIDGVTTSGRFNRAKVAGR